MLDPSAFKAYDVTWALSLAARRGRRLPHRACLRRALRAANDRRRTGHAAVVTHDGSGRDRRSRRRSGPDVIDIGLVGTEMVYYAVGELGLEGGICVTASHNPKQYTGMKVVRRGALPVGGDSGLEDVRARPKSF